MMPEDGMLAGTDSAVWRVRAAIWELLALSFRYPDAVLANAVACGEWAEAAEEVAEALGLELPEGFGADARIDAGEDPEALLRALRVEATRLFVGALDPVCSPYEGVWRASDDGVKALLFVNPHSRDVERFCRSCGLGRPEGVNEPLDHVATECELLEHLSLRAACSADLPRGCPEAAYSEFLADHARVWLPRFAANVVESTRAPFYRAAALLLAAAVEREV